MRESVCRNILEQYLVSLEGMLSRHESVGQAGDSAPKPSRARLAALIERACCNSCASPDLPRRRAESGFGNLAYRIALRFSELLTRAIPGDSTMAAVWSHGNDVLTIARLPEEPDSSRAQGSDTQLAPDNRRHMSAEDFYGVQHSFVWQRRYAHLECDARNATENFIHVKDLFRYRFSVAD